MAGVLFTPGRAGLALLAMGAVAGCETVPADPNNPPLRQVQTADEQHYLDCVLNDPFFWTPTCRQYKTRGPRGPSGSER